MKTYRKSHVSLYRKEGRAKRIIPQLLKSAGFSPSNQFDWGFDGLYLIAFAFEEDNSVLPYVRYMGENITLVEIPLSRYTYATRKAWAIRPGVTVEEVQEALSYM